MTVEGEVILDAVHGSTRPLQLRAFAGCGKTTMLNHIQRALPGPVLCLAFNKRIKDKMEKEFSNSFVKTFNGLGHSVWGQTCARKVTLDDKKTATMLRVAISQLPKPAQREAWDEYSDIVNAVGMAKSLGYVPSKWPNVKGLVSFDEVASRLDGEPSDLCVDLCEAVLLASIKAAYVGNIDFNDQIYMPTLFGGTFPKYANTLVDEAQDLNPVNHAMLRRLKGTRVIAVGDPWQSIYAFRGAVREGMNELRSAFDMTSLPLSVSFRCPEMIVRNAQWRAPEMKWVKPGGRVGILRNPGASSFPDGCAIICRNNAPLFATAIRLLASGRSVSVAGSDLGPKVVGLLKKLGPEEMNREQTFSAIENWRAEKLSKGSTTADDIADCMRVFAGVGDSLAQAISYASDLLSQEGTIYLSTGHKAKGLEWPVVYHLDPFLIRDGDQELNLRYVIQTRALEAYYEIESAEIRWDL